MQAHVEKLSLFSEIGGVERMPKPPVRHWERIFGIPLPMDKAMNSWTISGTKIVVTLQAATGLLATVVITD